MDDSKAQSIIATLANGVDPISGRVFPPDSPYQAPDVVRALFLAAQVLDAKVRNRGRVKGELPANAGKPWNDEEDRRLLAQFDGGQNLQDLARAHGRTVAGIQARLERHGRLEPAANAERRAPQVAGRAQPSGARGRGSVQS
jgi:hypothetical protein